MNKEKKLIGVIGADVIKVNIPDSIDTESKVRDILNDYNTNQTLSMARGVSLGKNNLRIRNKEFTFECALKHNVDSKPYIELELHAADDKGCNLQNMNLDTIWGKFYQALEILGNTYGIMLNFRKEDIRIISLEANNTIRTEKPCFLYKRVETLIANVSTCKNGVEFEARTKLNENGIAVEAVKIPGSTLSLSIYDKEKQLEKKSISTNTGRKLMRLEVRYQKNGPIKTDYGTEMLNDFSDELLAQGFAKRWLAIKAKASKHLDRMLGKLKANGKTQTTVSKILLSCLNTYTPELTDWCSFWCTILADEYTDGIVRLLDAKDLKAVFDWLFCLPQFSEPHARECVNSDDLFESCMETYRHIRRLGDVFSGQRILFEEIFSKATGCPETIEIYY